MITVQFEDPDRNISLVYVEVVEGEGWTTVEPHLTFNPRVGGGPGVAFGSPPS
jgi:hypothetical protein